MPTGDSCVLFQCLFTDLVLSWPRSDGHNVSFILDNPAGCHSCTATQTDNEIRYLQAARERGEMCRYDGCEKRFYEDKRREDHEKTVHERKGLKCEHCEKSFVTSAKSSLMRHMLIKHGISVKCTKCTKSFDNFNSYVTHRRQICNVQTHFKTSHRLNVERLGEPDPKIKSGKVLKTLSGESKCLLCGQITKNTNMARHMREKHNSTSANMPELPDYNKDLIKVGARPDPAKCIICDKKFKNVRSIPRHMKAAHPESLQ